MAKVYVEIVVVLLSIEDWLCGGKKLFFKFHSFYKSLFHSPNEDDQRTLIETSVSTDVKPPVLFRRQLTELVLSLLRLIVYMVSRQSSMGICFLFGKTKQQQKQLGRPPN